ncbi:hypothetical protein O1611_g5568 [Lasiodiplodia mahajangana]|uniref:Uncharacterized protein n=1 Tax=Lasiodiplodia mahajangana TaxID=1108764 RepID=A0ACC2JLC6_9PEZI|nr:hypothetical protein O1611_g5568 [Lasiodiplodia mahajangana]
MLKGFLTCFVAATSTAATLLEDLGLGLLEGRGHLARRSMTLANATCRTNYSTNIWNSCAQVLQQFNLTLDTFEAINPSIGVNCTNFIPGTTYCVSVGRKNLAIFKPNGMYGAQQNWTSTCIGSQWGDCCGVGGYIDPAVALERTTADLETAKRAPATEHLYRIAPMDCVAPRTTGLTAQRNLEYAVVNMDIAGMALITAVLAAKAAPALLRQRPPAP